MSHVTGWNFLFIVLYEYWWYRQDSKSCMSSVCQSDCWWRMERWDLSQKTFLKRKTSYMVFQVFPGCSLAGPSGPLLTSLQSVSPGLDSESLWFVFWSKTAAGFCSRTEGRRGRLVWDQSVVWVGGVRLVVGGGGYLSTRPVIVGSCTQRKEALWWCLDELWLVQERTVRRGEKRRKRVFTLMLNQRRQFL